MCLFITLAVAPRHAESVQRIAGRELEARPQVNTSIAKLVAPRATFVLTTGGCSCDLFGAKRNDGKAAEEDRGAARRKYAKLGWSAAKIERAIAARHTSADGGRGLVGLRNDAREIIARIAEETGDVALLVHAYSGDIERETVCAAQGPVSTPDELRSGRTSIPEDLILWIRPTQLRRPGDQAPGIRPSKSST
ncbi:MAG: hypothetical protein KF850_39045 [Labilithrix sp.]|nr:hypothetical protein [Labilithrix sp.]MBX3218069.1 hypothetical protein [Labilithrix sp.]